MLNQGYCPARVWLSTHSVPSNDHIYQTIDLMLSVIPFHGHSLKPMFLKLGIGISTPCYEFRFWQIG